mgnify:CR=1 FL=1
MREEMERLLREWAPRERIDFDCSLSRPVPADWATRRTLLQRLMQSWAYFLITRIDPFLARRKFRHLS